MDLIQQIIFAAALIVAAVVITRRVKYIAGAINLGRPEDRSDNPGERFNLMLLIAFGQKKMFTNLTVALMHLVIYVGFVIINLEILEIIIDGLLGTHRVFAPYIAPVYPFLIGVFEVLAFGVLAVCVVFLTRRYLTKVSRLQPENHEEMRPQWPRLDATLILIFEIVLMIAFLTWNASDSVLRDRGVGHYGELQGVVPDFLISQYLKPLFTGLSDGGLVAYERFSWWFHIIGILFFAAYVTYSKHLHIGLAFPNVYFSDLQPKGEMKNMPTITKEVQLALGIEPTIAEDPAGNATQDNENGEQPSDLGKFGAKDVPDLSWVDIMGAFSCTQCGRCTAACPANITGKKLSPRKIMMDTRWRAEEIMTGKQKNGADYTDDKSLLGDYTTVEEINACTTCQACVNACPININPLNIILQMRRYKVMEDAQSPASWNAMFSNVENNQAPWKFSPSDRFNWADEINQK
jgi:heterodisulfide reductase subunit C